MRWTRWAILAAATVWAAGPAEASTAGRAGPEEEAAAEIAGVLDDWHDAASKAAADRYFGHLAPGAVFLGTDATERWSVEEFYAYVKPYFDDGRGWTFVPRERNTSVDLARGVAWFDEALDSPHLGECRGSGVLIRKSDDAKPRWLIAQYNLTTPIPNDVMPEVLPMIAGHNARAEPTCDLRVMSFNIRYGAAQDGDDAWPLRKEMVFQIAREEWDAIGLQEALKFQIDEIVAAAPGYEAVGVGRDDGREKGEHSPILFRADRLELLDGGTFWLSDTPDVPGSKGWGNNVTRICTWARLRHRGSERAFWVFNCHLDHQSQPSRERSVELIASRIAARDHPDEPVILVGDFNAAEDNPAMLYVRGRAKLGGPGAESAAPAPLADAFRALHVAAAGVGTFNGFRGDTDGGKIDHILIGRGVRALDAGIDRRSTDGRYPSDHFPVWASVRLGIGG